MPWGNRPRQTDSERFWTKVDKRGPTDCWLWSAASDKKGYGVFRIKGRNVAAHRFAYQQTKGSIPQELECDHLCRVPLCVNPGHIELVSHQDNVLRGVSPAVTRAKATHCPHGHMYDLFNTWIDKHGHRHCRACHNIRSNRKNRPNRRASVTGLA